MAKEIYWRVFLNTKKKDKAEKLSGDIMKSYGNCKMVSMEPYWKDESLYCLELTQDLTDKTAEEITFGVLKKISMLSSSWSMDFPESFDKEDFDFSGVSDSNFKWNYVSWMSFVLQDKDVPILDVT